MLEMTVLAAAFTSESAARAAQRELIDRLELDPSALTSAPLGAVGRESDGRLIVAARVPGQAVGRATEIMTRHGGEVVTEPSASGATVGVSPEGHTGARTDGP